MVFLLDPTVQVSVQPDRVSKLGTRDVARRRGLLRCPHPVPTCYHCRRKLPFVEHRWSCFPTLSDLRSRMCPVGHGGLGCGGGSERRNLVFSVQGELRGPETPDVNKWTQLPHFPSYELSRSG